ncbi:hypothetical protein J4558_27765 [Leptolyngbya sp. 15MV]|nr:hypothetical protein J4558_27765 [Leptolyngbya sp. 15MV]
MVTRVPGTMLLVDPDAATADAWATGADENDYHVTGFTWQAALGQTLSDPGYVKVADLRNALQGDPSPRAPGSTLQTARGIEVGHIFKLGTKYSDAMGLKVLDDKQQSRSVIMGCYGIGVSRTLAACVEMSHDADGIIWPAAIAPYHVVITLIKPAEKTHADAASSLARALSAQGLDVLIDDRDERPGVKFKDADLIGIPVRITIGEKALADNAVEFKPRKAQGKGELVKIDQAPAACLKALGLSPE